VSRSVTVLLSLACYGCVQACFHDGHVRVFFPISHLHLAFSGSGMTVCSFPAVVHFPARLFNHNFLEAMPDSICFLIVLFKVSEKCACVYVCE